MKITHKFERFCMLCLRADPLFDKWFYPKCFFVLLASIVFIGAVPQAVFCTVRDFLYYQRSDLFIAQRKKLLEKKLNYAWKQAEQKNQYKTVKEWIASETQQSKARKFMRNFHVSRPLKL